MSRAHEVIGAMRDHLIEQHKQVTLDRIRQLGITMPEWDSEKIDAIEPQIVRQARRNLRFSTEHEIPWAEVGYTQPAESGHIKLRTQDYSTIRRQCVDLGPNGQRPSISAMATNPVRGLHLSSAATLNGAFIVFAPDSPPTAFTTSSLYSLQHRRYPQTIQAVEDIGQELGEGMLDVITDEDRIFCLSRMVLACAPAL